MNYTISSGEQKDILIGDVVELPEGLYQRHGVDITAVLVTDVDSQEIIGVSSFDFETKQLLESFELSPSWVVDVWRLV